VKYLILRADRAAGGDFRVGDLCHVGTDYGGLCSGDHRLTGIEHVMVSRDVRGYPGYTIPREDVEPRNDDGSPIVYQPELGPWIVVRQTAIRWPGGRRPTMGYELPADLVVHSTQAAASEYLRNNHLPLGWVTMSVRQDPWTTLGTFAGNERQHVICLCPDCVKPRNPRPDAVLVISVPGDTVPTLSAGSPGDAEYDSWKPLPSRTQYVAHLEKALAGWKEEAQRLRDECNGLLEQLQTRTQHQRRDTWFWQGDGSDHIKSMSNSMVVVIRASQLRRLLAGAPPALGELRGRHDDFNGDTPHLINCMRALVNLDQAGAVKPPIGGHARALLLAAASRLEYAMSQLVKTGGV
jgi:hypothetical protein